jgi:hypothetical protein
MRGAKVKKTDLRDREGRGVEPLEARKLLSTAVYYVTDTSDNVNDSGSFRNAITQANGLSSSDHAVIIFEFLNSTGGLETGLQTIKLTSALPAITGRVDILGPTDSDGNPLVVLDGADAGSGVSGLVFDRSASADTAASVVSGLVIDRFSGDGIDIGGSAPTDVFGCWIGTDSTGKHSQPNGGDGIQITNDDDRIGAEGGTAYADVISGNGEDGVLIDTGADGNTIQDCRVGTDVTGRHALVNGGDGLDINGDQTLIGGDRTEQGNVISGNKNDGVAISSNGCVMYGNLVGTNAAGTAAVGNGGDGVQLDNSASNNEIGNDGAPFANVISGNGESGVFLTYPSNSNLIEGNNIGTNEAGTAAIPNSADGIEDIDSNNNTAEFNVVSGNTIDGILVESTEVGLSASGNTVKGNDVGVNEAGTAAIPNGGDGIEYVNSSDNTDESNVVSGNKQNGILIETTGASFSASGNDVGGDQLGVGKDGLVPIPNGNNGVEILQAAFNGVALCTIEDNKLAGVQINGIEAVNNLISSNDISSNGLLGICLGADTDTPLPNHSLLAKGPNHDQNYPVLTSAAVTDGVATVDGTLNSLPDHSYVIEFFDNTSVDPSGFGQGEEYAGETTVTTDANGNADFTATDVQVLSGQQFITAVAHDTTSAAVEQNDTSEFSKAITVTGATVSGTVFDDANGSGKLEAGDKGVANVTVYAEVGSAKSTEIEATTNSAGQFKIIGLEPNVATEIHVDVPDGFVQTDPGAKRPYYKVTLAADGSQGGLDFGIEKSASASAVVLPQATAVIDLVIKKTTIARELLG